MVESQLRPQGVTDHGVIAAMASVPREDFVSDHARPLAYMDRGVDIGSGRFLSAPTVLGQLLTQIAPQAGEKALVVGAGTGYSAAILKHIGCNVVALESDASLAARARDHGLNVVESPLGAGAKRGAPYQHILIDGAVEFIPDAIVAQLADGGRLGAALLDRGIARLVVGRRAGNGFGLHSIADYGAAALPGFAKPRGFTF